MFAEFSNETVFGSFVERLWRGGGVRLLFEVLHALRAGRHLNFGEALVHDDGVILPRHKFFGANEQVPCDWNDVHIWTSDGSFYIGAKSEKKVRAGMSYIHTPNAHVLEHAIRMGFKKGIRKLSDILPEGS